MLSATMDSSVRAGADILIKTCGGLRSGEAVTVVYDATTEEVARVLLESATALTARVIPVKITPLSMHGQEPPQDAAEAMASSDLCLGVTAKSMAHTQARFAAAKKGARYLSLPDYSLSLLASPSLRADYHLCAGKARQIAGAFTRGRRVRVTSPAGTDIVMDIKGRIGNCCPGFVEKPGELGSPPNIESNVSPIEDSAQGTVIVDGSIPYPGLGLLKKPIHLEVRRGLITNFTGDKTTVAKLRRLFDAVGTNKTRVLAECGVGLNSLAELTGVMLTDEGAAGTMHFGFGSNATVGGKNAVPFHLDFVFRRPSLDVDGKVLIEEGVLKI